MIVTNGRDTITTPSYEREVRSRGEGEGGMVNAVGIGFWPDQVNEGGGVFSTTPIQTYT